jgi:hypothetical protein
MHVQVDADTVRADLQVFDEALVIESEVAGTEGVDQGKDRAFKPAHQEKGEHSRRQIC